MSWLANNWIWVVLVAGFLAFHLFGHGHGHGGHRRAQQLPRQEPEPGVPDGQKTTPGQAPEREHRRHGGC